MGVMTDLYISFHFEVDEDQNKRQIYYDFVEFIEDELHAKRDGTTSSRVASLDNTPDELWNAIEEFISDNINDFWDNDTLTFIMKNDEMNYFLIGRYITNTNRDMDYYDSLEALFDYLPE